MRCEIKRNFASTRARNQWTRTRTSLSLSGRASLSRPYLCPSLFVEHTQKSQRPEIQSCNHMNSYRMPRKVEIAACRSASFTASLWWIEDILFSIFSPFFFPKGLAARAYALRVGLGVGGATIASGSHARPSHSWTSRLLTSSFSLGVSSLFCRATQCM